MEKLFTMKTKLRRLVPEITRVRSAVNLTYIKTRVIHSNLNRLSFEVNTDWTKNIHRSQLYWNNLWIYAGKLRLRLLAGPEVADSEWPLDIKVRWEYTNEQSPTKQRRFVEDVVSKLWKNLPLSNERTAAGRVLPPLNKHVPNGGRQLLLYTARERIPIWFTDWTFTRQAWRLNCYKPFLHEISIPKTQGSRAGRANASKSFTDPPVNLMDSGGGKFSTKMRGKQTNKKTLRLTFERWD